MKEIVTDLRAEQEALDSFLCTLKDEQWDVQTPAEGWTVRDSISHIAYIDEVSVSFIRGDYTALDEAAKLGMSYNETGPKRGRTMQPSQILKWWRDRAQTDLCASYEWEKFILCATPAQLADALVKMIEDES